MKASTSLATSTVTSVSRVMSYFQSFKMLVVGDVLLV